MKNVFKLVELTVNEEDKMKLQPEEYQEEMKSPAPFYSSPLSRKAQRVYSRGRSNKPKCFSKEEVFLYKCKQASKLTTWEV